MVKRKIIIIDEDKCNGCGNCVTGCQEGALQIIDGKAKLVNEQFCDGFGDCIGTCPTGALKIEEKETKDFDLEATKEHVKNIRGQKGVEKMLRAQQAHSQPVSGGCPGSRMMNMNKTKSPKNTNQQKVESELQQWPIQLHLLSPQAPYLNNSNLFISADCVPVAYGDFQKLLKGKIIALGCPKLDNAQRYIEKLTEIIKYNNIQSITVARMEVPCCGGLVQIVKNAIDEANSNLELNIINISIDGNIISESIA